MKLRPLPALAVALLVVPLFAPRSTAAQRSNVDVIRGRLVAADSAPVAGAIVTVSSYITQAVRQVRTDDRGRFSLVFQNGGGDYILSVIAIGIAPSEVRVRREGDEDVLLVNLVLNRIRMLDAVTVTERQRPAAERVPTEVGAAGGTLGGTVLSPEQQGNLNALAAALAGFAVVTSADGTITGFSALGLDASQNTVTLNGMQVGSTSMPRDAQLVTRANTSSFDASNGRFSGAQVSMFAMGGGPIQQHSMRITLDNPSLQWYDRSATSLNNQLRNIAASGNSSGELVHDKLNYNMSWQLGRRTTPLNTLLDADSSGLARLGLSPDSVQRFESIIREFGLPFTVGAVPPDRRSENGSLFGHFEFNPTNGGALNGTINGSFNRNSAQALSPRALPSYGGSSEGWNANVQGEWSHNVGSMFLNQLSVSTDVNGNNGNPFVPLPAGSVLVSALAPDGGTSLSSLNFGSGSGLNSASHGGSFDVSNTISWFNKSSRHRLKLEIDARTEWYQQLEAANERGTFTYNSLADLEAGRAASFVRRIGTQQRSGSGITSGASLTDTWRKTDRLQFQLGLRADGVHFLTAPNYNPEIDRLFGLRTDQTPRIFGVSPRFGFSYNVGKAPGGVGGVFGPNVLGTIRGGIGRFMNTPGPNLISGAIDATGLPSGAQQLTCIGPAVPQVNWREYLRDESAIPTTCADGTGAAPFTIGTPRVQTFGPGFATPSSWRANLGWNSYLTPRFRVNVDATYSVNQHQSAQLDRNFDPTVRFTLPAEGGRPVFVDPSAIFASTGAVSLLNSRRYGQYAQVMENLGDGESRTAQLTIGLSPVPNRVMVNPTNWNISWTTVRVRDRVRGYGGNTATNPLDFSWGRASGDIVNQFNASINRGFGPSWQVRMSARAQSGSPFTPTVGGDVNGDGLSNDRAFVFDPAVTADSAVAAGMRSILAGAPAGIQSCLRSQLGKVADRNSCRGPWSVTMSATVNYTPRGTSLGDRASFTLNLSNPLAGLDALVHHGAMEGWGQPGFADPTLLYVRGFDPATHRYKYEVNQRFGETRGTRSLPAQPFRVTLEMRLSLGPPMERQQAKIELRGFFRAGQPAPTVQTIKQRAVNGAASSLRQLVQQKDSIPLRKEQLDSVGRMIASLTKAADSIWTPMAQYIVKNGVKDAADAEAVRRLRETKRAVEDAQFASYRALRTLLTPEQRKRLKPPLAFMIEEDYQKQVRLMGARTIRF
ncbi:MAG TPA: carboxypeptidase-like regulatory domain-containing protein [Gemmatimonadaceae bacterium]|nr:carboxypeptidase-like regulatory domain-containing protein [Gemmatimonadaceae bacterium]